MPKVLVSEQRGCERSTVHADKRTLLTAEFVDGPGDNLLACSAFATDENGGREAQGGDFRNRLPQISNRLVTSDKTRHVDLIQRRLASTMVDGGHEIFDLDGLAQVTKRAPRDTLKRQPKRPPPRKSDDLYLRAMPSELLLEARCVHDTGELEVQTDNVHRRSSAKELHGTLGIAERLDLVTASRELGMHTLKKTRVVINDGDARSRDVVPHVFGPPVLGDPQRNSGAK